MTYKIIMDVDTGIDDAQALMFAVRHPDVEVLAISCVAGNTPVQQVLANTLAILDLVDAPEIPVAAGATRPLVEPARPADYAHGPNGLGELELPTSQRSGEDVHSVELMRRTLLAAPEPVTLVALAPMTNLALLLRLHPEVTGHLERIVFMGGSASVGNATAVAEFNTWQDPEAAAIVFDSGVPLTMYGLDVFDRVRVPPGQIAELKASDDPVRRAVGVLLSHELVDQATGKGEPYGVIGDAGAVCALVAPEHYTFQSWPIQVDLAPGIGRGQTQVDRRLSVQNVPAVPWPRADVALEVDVDAVLDLFFATVTGSGTPTTA